MRVLFRSHWCRCGFGLCGFFCPERNSGGKIKMSGGGSTIVLNNIFSHLVTQHLLIWDSSSPACHVAQHPVIHVVHSHQHLHQHLTCGSNYLKTGIQADRPSDRISTSHGSSPINNVRRFEKPSDSAKRQNWWLRGLAKQSRLLQARGTSPVSPVTMKGLKG